MKCPRCQQENPPQAKFCLECATPLKSVSLGGSSAPSYSDVTNALSEALEQQTATAEILRVISRSPTSYEPVFDAIVRSASMLCRAPDVIVLMLEGGGLRAVASIGPVAAAVRQSQLLDGGALPLTREYVSGRAFIDRRTVHVQDVSAMPDEYPVGTALQRQYGGRGTTLSVPLLRDDAALGVITLVRDEVNPFSEQQVALLKTFADQAVIAIENVRLFNETKDALGRETATAEILRVIASSPTALQPALDAIATNAALVCDAYDAVVFLREGDHVRPAAHHGPITITVQHTTLSQGSITETAILDRQPVHVHDVLATEPRAFPLTAKAARAGGFRTVLAVPLLREHEAIGALAIRRREVQPFTPQQIELLKTFADQAVIAIENVRLFNGLQTSNRDLTKALDTQTATSDILRVISRSQTDVQPVYDAIVESAVRLLRGFVAAISRLAGDQLELAAFTSMDPGGDAAVKSAFPQAFASDLPHSRVVRERGLLNVTDARSDPQLPEAIRNVAVVRGYQSLVVLPMLRHDEAIGAISVTRREPGGFTDDEISLLRTFADQAVIAIENVRLFTELREKNQALTEAHAQVSEALERQTATSEILRVISRSQTDVQPVFDTIVQSAVRLCAGLFGALFRFDGELLHMVAHHNYTPEALEAAHGIYPARPSRDHGSVRAIVERAVVHIPDVELDPEHQHPGLRRAIGQRSGLFVPMLREGDPIGVIMVSRPEPGPFSNNEIEMLKTFADQAVIAIENVRLFTELQSSNRELTTALDTQTATSEILRVISQSPTDVQPVFDAIVRNAVRLCDGLFGSVYRFDGERIHLAANYNFTPEQLAHYHRTYPRVPSDPGDPVTVIRTGRVLHIPDVEIHPGFLASPPDVQKNLRWRGIRSAIGVPMLRQDQVIGAIFVSHRGVDAFTDEHVELLKTFAHQAVIAVENVRLFKELEARTAALTRSVDQLTALGEVGRAVSSTLDLATVLTTIVSRAVELSGLDGGVVLEYNEREQEFVQRAQAETGGPLAAARRGTRIRKGEGVVGRTAMTLEPIQVADITAPGAYVGPNRENLIESGVRAILAVPMVREGQLIGCLGVTRNQPGEFPRETIELLRTFSAQSALAIQNARLFQEIEEKSRQLEVASQHKSEFLANMSHELRTPLNAIIGFSEVLTERMFGDLNEKQEEYLKDIYASGQHLLSLINDILDLSKIEAGRMELELTDFDLPTAVDNALTLVRERAGRRGIALHQAVDQRLGQIRGDERKIKQVLLNLLSNALKFTPEGGRVDVRATVSDGMAEVSVSDTGVGIAPEDQEAVFEEFRQVGTADKKVEGTGLGLALSRKFIELHGGRIWVQSQVDVGSTFTFTIPVRRVD